MWQEARKQGKQNYILSGDWNECLKFFFLFKLN